MKTSLTTIFLLCMLLKPDIYRAQQIEIWLGDFDQTDQSIAHNPVNDEILVASSLSEDPATASGILLTCMDLTNTVSWAKQLTFSDIDRVAHLTWLEDEEEYLLLTNGTMPSDFNIRDYQFAPFLTRIDAGGNVLASTQIQQGSGISWIGGADMPYDITATRVAPYRDGFLITGFISTGFAATSTDFIDDCKWRFSFVTLLDDDLNIMSSYIISNRPFAAPEAGIPYNWKRVSANYVVADDDNELIYVTGQGATADDNVPVAYITCLDFNGTIQWHRAWVMQPEDGNHYYGSKLFFNHNGNLLWFLRETDYYTGGGDNQGTNYGLAEVDPSSGNITNISAFDVDHMIPGDVEYSGDQVFLSSYDSEDNQTLASIDWLGMHFNWVHLYNFTSTGGAIDPRTVQNNYLDLSPYFEMGTPPSLTGPSFFIPNNMIVTNNRLIVANTDRYNADLTSRVSVFDHWGFYPAGNCSTATWPKSNAGLDYVDGSWTEPLRDLDLNSEAQGPHSEDANICLFGCGVSVNPPCEGESIAGKKGSGLTTIAANELTVFPSPADGKLNVKVPVKGRYNQISIMDLSGKVLFIREVTKFESGDIIEIDISEFSSGYYQVELQSTENNQKIQTIFVK